MMKKLTIACAIVAIGLVSGTAAQAQQDPDIYPPGDDRSLDLDGFVTECVADVPYVTYDIVTVGFVADPPVATLTVRDINGTIVDFFEDVPLQGQFIYPGAAVDAEGNGIAWPGWVQVDGEWVELPPGEGTSILREGLEIQVDVNPTDFVFVTYPDADPNCADPGLAGESPGTATPQGIASQGELPSTGSSGITMILQAGFLALVAGGLAFIAAHRRTNRSHIAT